MQGLSLDLPTGYYMERDPDVLVLRRPDGSMVGAFSARGAAPEAVRQMVEETVREEPSAYLQEAPAYTPRPSLQVRFFGHFEMFCDGNAMHLGRNGKALTILKYLLANRRRPVSQDHLMGWLWPESNLKKARWSLNSAIHGLRKLLGGCSSALSTNYVTLEDGYYHLSEAVRIWTDVDKLDERYETGRRLEREGRMPAAAVEYEKAIELYRGDYLIEDLYDDWTMVERERLSNAYMDMLGRLAVHYMESGQYQESIRGCYRVLEKDRCHEDTYRLLMRCYTRLGLRGRALHQYRMCQQILGQEYGTSPSPETRSLYASLLRDQSA
ncbi:MAG: winged helix-turn-helix domain-containing protein [Rubrobacter sp.]|nr:winged helix-turn-helix domain-containing protein [Rubrobacter sp.]